jgi:catechol 2,3-dioxygenase-like lactoylglutathione lyase family enzyme
MISYVTVGTNDLDKALEFYDSLITELGGKRMFEAPNGQIYGFSEGSTFWFETS